MTFKPANWKCPHCGNYQTLTNAQISERAIDHFYGAESRHGTARLEGLAISCANPQCRELTYRVVLLAGPSGGANVATKRFTATPVLLHQQNLRPRSAARVWPPYIPQAVREDYEEACLIAELSPKAAATLARRCLQGMIRDFCQIQDATLAKEILHLRDLVTNGQAPKGVSGESIDAIDAIRTIGNIGAHMERDVNVIIPIDEGEARALISVLELLAEEWYVARQQREDRLQDIQRIAAEKKAAQTKATKPTGKP